MDSTSSTFRIPVLLPPPVQTETLLFNDILEEKTNALRSTFTEFLQVQPYHKFHAEFSNFLKRTKRIIQEGHRNGTNISRIVNSTEIAPVYCRQSSTVYRPQTTLSVIGSNVRSAFKIPEPIEQSNNQPRNQEINIPPTVQLSRIDGSVNATSSFEPPAICPTIIEESQNNSPVASTSNHPVSATKPKPERNSYSDVTVIEGRQKDLQNDDSSNAVESLLDNAGFKIIIGMPDGSYKSKNDNESQVKIENPTVLANDEKYLSKWSANMKFIKSASTTKVVIVITGCLLMKDQKTVDEKYHDAGFLEGRKENRLIKTTHGLYRLIGSIIGGSPNDLYHVCLEVRGIPRTWRNILKKLSDHKKDNKTATLNLTLESPAGPSTARQIVKPNLELSMTRRGSLFNAREKIVAVQSKNNIKRKNPENDSTYVQTIKQRKLTKQLPPLMTSTPFRATKNRTSTIVKPKTPEKTTNGSKQVLGDSTAGSSRQSSRLNNSKTVSKTLKNDITTRSVKNVRSPLVNNSKKTNNTLAIDKSTKTEKVANPTQPTLVNNSKVVNKTSKNVKVVKPSKKETIKNATTKVTKHEGKKLSGRKVANNKETSKKPKKQSKSPRAQIGLFDNVDFSAFGDMSDFNEMALPSATYTDTSRSAGSSRSETPPLYGHQWSKSGKSIAMSEGPSILSKSLEAKALKNRIKAPKFTLEEQLKNNRRTALNKGSVQTNYKKVTNQINQMLQFGEQFDYDDDSSFETSL